MEARSAQFIAEACGGKLRLGDGTAQVRRVCTDSRQIAPGDLFIALRGEKFDGHDFIPVAVAKGAAAAMIEAGTAELLAGKLAVIEVDNTRAALGRLAARYRTDFALPMVAVGGSNGKTTTKEILASVLRQRFAVLWSEASFNNDIGVPLTVLKLEKVHQAAVLEVGTNHPGELAPLVKIIRPQYGIVTSIGREHLEFFGDIAGVAQEEGWLAELLPGSGKLYLNADNEWTTHLIKRTRAEAVQVGFTERSDWRIRTVRMHKAGVEFAVDAPSAVYSGEYRINLLGRHQATNALLAIAVAVELGLSREEIQAGLLACAPAKMRLQVWELNGFRVLDDAYNANADSVIAALQTLREVPCKGRRLAVLGDMAELGHHSEAAHEEVGRRAAELGVGQLFAVGKMAPVMARGARDAGLNRVFEFLDVDAAASAVKSFVRPGDVLLLKASRATRLERIAEHLRRGAEPEKKN